MKKEIVKKVPLKPAVTLTFNIYEGFEDIESLESKMSSLGIYEKQFMIVYFLKQYYGVVNQSVENALVVGKKIVWVKEGNLWTYTDEDRPTVPFVVGSLYKGPLGNSEIIKDLNELDKEIQVLNGYKTGWRDIKECYQYAPYFAELLGRTFYTTFFTKETAPYLSVYGIYDESEILSVLRQPRIQGVNPFRTEALYVTGKSHCILI